MSNAKHTGAYVEFIHTYIHNNIFNMPVLSFSVVGKPKYQILIVTI